MQVLELAQSELQRPLDGDQSLVRWDLVGESPDGEESFTIVGSTEARPTEGRISNESPVGRALLGKKKGEKVLVKVPAGDFTYKIVGIA